MKIRTKRLLYALVFLLLIGIEVCIALFVHDGFVRPYGGDIIVVMVIYCFVRIFAPEGLRLLAIYVFLFAVFVELMQFVNIVGLLHLENNTLLRTVIGTTFSWEDIVCYAVGSIILGSFEFFKFKRDVSQGQT